MSSKQKVADGNLHKLKEYYLSDASVTLREVAAASQELVGVVISEDRVRGIAMRDRWGVEKRRMSLGKTGLPTDLADEADDLRQIILGEIMDPEKKLDPRDLATLVNAYDKLKSVAPRRKSAKTPRQLQIEATRRAIEKMKKYESSR